MKKIIGIFLLLIFFSCEKEKTEFIQSKVVGNLFLIKNPPKSDSLLKNPQEYSPEKIRTFGFL